MREGVKYSRACAAKSTDDGVAPAAPTLVGGHVGTRGSNRTLRIDEPALPVSLALSKVSPQYATISRDSRAIPGRRRRSRILRRVFPVANKSAKFRRASVVDSLSRIASIWPEFSQRVRRAG